VAPPFACGRGAAAEGRLSLTKVCVAAQPCPCVNRVAVWAAFEVCWLEKLGGAESTWGVVAPVVSSKPLALRRHPLCEDAVRGGSIARGDLERLLVPAALYLCERGVELNSNFVTG
jgi:hypothetical protein